MGVILVTDESGEEQERWEGNDYDLWETEQVYQDLALEDREDGTADAPDDLGGYDE